MRVYVGVSAEADAVPEASALAKSPESLGGVGVEIPELIKSHAHALPHP